MKKKIIKVDKKAFKKIPKFKVTLPKCFQDNNFMYCWCGKCKQENYKLPTDLHKHKWEIHKCECSWCEINKTCDECGGIKS